MTHTASAVHAGRRERVVRIPILKLAFCLLALGISGLMLFRFFSSQRSPEEQAYFYDLSEQKLFTAPRTAVPPIRGLNDSEQDAVRAIVVSTSGNPKDERHRRIAYLEKYAAELKQQIESRQMGGATIPVGKQIDRIDAQNFTLVRRVQESQWHAVNTPEGERIMTEWMAPGPKGETPVVCVP